MSGLQYQTVELPFFAGGLDSKTSPLKVQAPKLLLCENGVFTNPGQINKRNGFAKNSSLILGSRATVVPGKALMTYKQELLTADGANLYSYDKTNDAQVFKGPLYSTDVTQRSIYADVYNQFGADENVHPGGLQFDAWESSSGGTYYKITDTLTGNIVSGPSLLNVAAIKPKVLVLPGSFLVLTFNVSTAQLVAYQFPVSNPSGAPLSGILQPASASTESVNTTNPNYDAAVVNGNVYWVFDSAASGVGVTVSGSIGSNPLVRAFSRVVVASGNGATPVCVFADPSGGTGSGVASPAIVYIGGGNVNAACYDATLIATNASGSVSKPSGTIVSITAASRIAITAAPRFATSVNNGVFFTVSAGQTYNYLTYSCLISATYTISAPRVWIRSVGLSGKTFLLASGYLVVPVAYDSLNQPTYFLIDEVGTVATKMLYQNGGGIPLRGDSKGFAILPETSQPSPGVVRLPLLFIDQDRTSGGQVVATQTGVLSATVSMAPDITAYSNVEIGNLLTVGGGFAAMYDGLSAVELGFHLYPDPVTEAIAGTAGGLSAGQYQVVATYEWIDNLGQRQISAPSIPVTFTAMGTETLTVTVPTLRITAKSPSAPIPRSAVMINIYRTIANGTIFYLSSFGLVPAASGSATNQPVLNDLSVDTVVMTDVATDLTIQGGRVLYTTGGVQDHIPPNPISDMVVWQNRIIALDSMNPLQLWFTPPVLPGNPPNFGDAFIMNVDPRGGPVTALSVIDEQLIIFKADRIFYVTGSGPDATDNQYQWSDPQQIETDVGCTNPRSIVVTPIGNMFQTAKGIYLLTRALTAEYLPEAQRYSSNVITSACLIPNSQRVQFTTDTQDGVIVYDYFVRQWATFPRLAASDSVIWGGEFTWLRDDGTSWTETPGLFVDPDSNFVRLRATLAWTSFAGLQGFQRIQRLFFLGIYKSAHQLLFRIAYNYAGNFTPVWSDNFTISPDAPSTWGSDSVWGGNPSIPTDTAVWGGAGTPYQYRVNPTTQKCQSLTVQLEESQDGTNGEGLSLVGIAMTYGIKRGGFKLPAGQTVG